MDPHLGKQTFPFLFQTEPRNFPHFKSIHKFVVIEQDTFDSTTLSDVTGNANKVVNEKQGEIVEHDPLQSLQSLSF